MNDYMRSPTDAILRIIRRALFLCAFGVAVGSLPQTSLAENDAIPKRGGTLRLALPTDVTSLDPALAFDTISAPFIMLLYQGLVEYDDGLKLLTGLAKDWTISADQRTYTFHLRPGIQFSNGREVVADDFVFTLERNLDPKMAGL